MSSRRERPRRSYVEPDTEYTPEDAPPAKAAITSQQLNFHSTKPNKRGSTSPKRKPPPAPSTPPRSSGANATASTSASPRLAIKFGGKVFRTLDQSAGVSYSPNGDLFGEPDEEVGESDREKGEARRKRLENEMLSRLSPSKRSASTHAGDTLTTERSKRRAPETPTKSRPTYVDTPLPPSKASSSTPPKLGLPFSPSSSSSSSSVPLPPLPPPLAALLALHCTLESAIVMHLASEGAAVASTTSELDAHGQAVIRIPNLIHLGELRRKIESGGRTFGERELAQLVWVWEGCPSSSSFGPSSTIVGEDDDDDEDLTLETGESGGMGFLVTRTRMSGPTGVVPTFGIGISVAFKANPQRPAFELLPIPPASPTRSPKTLSPTRRLAQGSPESPGRVGRGREGMSVVALWSQGQEGRRREFAARLRDWAKEWADQQDPTKENHLPPIPQATLPSILPSMAYNSLPTPSASPIKRSVDVFGAVVEPPSATQSAQVAQLLVGKQIVKKGGSIEQRRLDLAERIRLKNRGGAVHLESMMALSDGLDQSNKSLKPEKNAAAWRAEETARLKRNSMLSRLAAVADGIWMLFEVGRKRAMEMHDVTLSISKSSSSNLSIGEAHESVALLCSICPDFCYAKLIDREQWLFVKGFGGLKAAKELVRAELQKARNVVM